jgi:uncharacterized protein YndB with AHSA1/START domain
MRSATLQRTGARPILRFERHLSKSPAEVWRALTDPDELATWFPERVVIDEWKVGAAITFVFEGGQMEPMTGAVLEYDEPARLAFTWGPETLRFELTATGDGGTDLVLTDELDPAHAARNAAGWDVCLAALTSNGDGGAAPDWKPLFEHYVAAFESELGPQEGPPPGFE